VATSLTFDNCDGLALSDEGYNISSDGSCGFSQTGSANNGIDVDRWMRSPTTAVPP
jgi:hypothetical protein